MFSTDHHINAIRIVREMTPTIGIQLPEELWQEFPLDLNSETVAFSMHQQIGFHRRLVQIMKDPLLGLKIAGFFPAHAYGMFGFGMMCAPTIRESLRFAAEFGRLTYTLQTLHFIETHHEGELRFTATGLNLGPNLRTFFADRDLGSTKAGIRFQGEDRDEMTRVQFEHDDQGQPAAYENHFQCPVIFNAEYNSVFYENTLLDRPNPYRHASAFEICRRECSNQMTGLADSRDIVGQVRQELFQRPGYLQDVESIARQLNTSVRTLRRRLEEKGTSFIDLQQEVRYQQAREHLRNRKLSISQISDILGYNDPANFSTAFKRWTNGTSPRDYRKIQFE